jgi:hypothetical protein
MRIPDHVLSWKSAGISAPGVETHVWPVRSTVQVEATDRGCFDAPLTPSKPEPATDERFAG